MAFLSAVDTEASLESVFPFFSSEPAILAHFGVGGVFQLLLMALGSVQVVGS